jgi:Mg2+/Co2+ transporter CorB
MHKYQHREINRGVGHNLPQEAPKTVTDAVLEVAAQPLLGALESRCLD